MADVADEELRQLRDQRAPGQTKPGQPESNRDKGRGVERGLGEDLIEFVDAGLEAVVSVAQLAKEGVGFFGPLVAGAFREGNSQVDFQSGDGADVLLEAAKLMSRV